MKDIPVIRGRHYIAAAVAEGEHEHQDFKYVIPDAHKIARSISAFANAGGGRLLIGVKDNGTVAGVRNEEDIYVVEQAAERYCDPPQQVEFTAFRVDSSTVVIRASIARSDVRPVRSQEPDGRWRAYYRVADENVAAHPLMLRMWRLRDEAAPAAMSLDSDATALLGLLRGMAPRGMDCRAMALALSMSQRRVEDMVVRLAAVGVVKFVYSAPGFVIAAADEEDSPESREDTGRFRGRD